MSGIALFLADGFEEIEALTTVDMCRRAGINITTVSVMDSLDVMGSHNIPVRADMLFDDVDFESCEMLVLPGGGVGTENLEGCEKLISLLKKADSEKKYISAICAAPRIPGRLGMLNGKKACCYPGNEKFLQGAMIVSDSCRAVTDGRFITGRGMGASIEFASEIIAQLKGRAAADGILDKIMY